jgi:hypothetical protein
MHTQAAGYLSATQSAGTTNFHSLGTSLHSTEHHLFHSPAVSNTALNLLSDGLGHEMSIKLGLLNLLNIQLHPLTDQPFKVTPRFIDTLPATPDDNAGSGRIDSYRDLV